MKIEVDSFKKLVEIYNLLNQIEIRGISNLTSLYRSMAMLQEVVAEIDRNNKEGIVIDNTKGG